MGNDLEWGGRSLLTGNG